MAASGQRVVIVWAATAADKTNIHAAVSDDGGATFSQPVRVNDVEGDARVNGEQPPRVAVGRDIDVVWESRQSGASQVRFAKSTDGGRTFQPAVSVHDASLSGARGWSSLVMDSSGLAHIVWLDGRNAVPKPAGAGHAAGGHAHQSPTRQDIFHVTMRPDGTRLETPVATDVCFCCKTSVAVARDGATFVAWRHIYPTNLRDMAVARSTDGARTFSAPVRVSEDGWEISGCPEDGPSIAVDEAGIVHIAWPTIVSPGASRKGIFYSYSSDGAKTFTPRVRIDEGDDVRNAAHPQITLTGGRVAIVWDETAGAGPRARVRMVGSTAPAGSWHPELAPPVTLSDPEPVSYPAVAPLSDGMVAAWTTITPAGSEIHTRKLVFDRRQ